MIAVEQVRKTYGKTVAVSSVSLVAPNGVVTGLLGPNGAGKTTVLRMLTGLVKPDRGRAAVDECDVHRRPLVARSRLGVLPEQVGLYDRLSVREHLTYSGELRGLVEPELGRRVDQMQDRLALTAIARQPAGKLSLGQRRRVALACALIHNPSNVVLDEPTNGLDVLSAREVRRTVRDLASSGCAVVLSSHVMPEVTAVCDRIVILARGFVVAAGTSAEILAQAGSNVLEEAFVRLIGSEEGLN
jgi:sodium transport system ATP-binding protein